jgi:hypothetical protein
MNATGATACLACPQGYFCAPDFTFVRDCPAGKYCPTGTGVPQFDCPIGTFSMALNLRSVNECVACSAGSYCQTAGLTAPTGT